ncbi:MAG: beta-galactosidase [Chloroflexota bacterium]
MNLIQFFKQRAVLVAIILLITLIGVFSACTPTETSEPTLETESPTSSSASAEAVDPVNLDAVMSSPDYGMQVFLFWQEEVADRDLRLVQEAGFRWVKQEIPWREIEGHSKGAWAWDKSDRLMDQIDAYELKVIVRLGSQPEWASNTLLPEVSPPDDLQDFYDYVYAVADRYKGRVEAYQVWNEPNLAREWGDRPPSPEEYVELLKVAHSAIKAADPNAIVISAGLAPTTRNDQEAMPDIYFVQGMYDAGAAPYFDALGVHAPGYKSPPEIDPAEVARDPDLNNGDGAPEILRRVYSFRHVEDIREIMVQNGDEAKKVVILEFGWTVEPRENSPYYWHRVDRIQQAQYFERAYAYAIENWQPWIGVMSLIYVANPAWHMDMEETYWSIVYPYYPEARVAPAYEGLKKLDKVPAVE